MKFEVMTHLAPDEVIRRAADFFDAKTGMEVRAQEDGRIEFGGVIGVASISTHTEYDHTVVHAETDRGVGFDVTDVTLRFLYTIPHL